MKKLSSSLLRMCGLLAAALLHAAAYAGPPAPPLPSLPKLSVPTPPSVVLIPGTYAYFAPDMRSDLIFYRGYWYRPHHGRWYRASGYGGPWGVMPPGRVPRVLIDLPPGFRNVPPGHQRIPHGQLQSNWRNWEREKHWYRRAAPVAARKGFQEPQGHGGKASRKGESDRHSYSHDSGGGHGRH